jgi:hypothetical protein
LREPPTALLGVGGFLFPSFISSWCLGGIFSIRSAKASRRSSAALSEVAMSESDYEWPRYPVGPKGHLEALGVISLNFNLYEYSLVIFLEQHFSKEVSAFLADKLSNEERSQLIRMIMTTDRELIEEIEFLLAHFATCAHNRHTLLHSRPGIPILGTPEDKVLSLEKFAKGEPERLIAFRLEKGDLRRTADEMRAGFDFVINLWRYLFDREHYYKVLMMTEEQEIPPPPSSVYPTLPKRPREPRRIDPDQPFEGH